MYADRPARPLASDLPPRADWALIPAGLQALSSELIDYPRTPDNRVNILGIDNIVIDVTDLDQARFYGAILGLTEKYAFPDRGVVGYRISRSASPTTRQHRTLPDMFKHSAGHPCRPPATPNAHQRGNRQVQVLGHERDHLPAGLQDRHVNIR
jgi:hypothetical protein